jgi:hypothetical protein
MFLFIIVQRLASDKPPSRGDEIILGRKERLGLKTFIDFGFWDVEYGVRPRRGRADLRRQRDRPSLPSPTQFGDVRESPDGSAGRCDGRGIDGGPGGDAGSAGAELRCRMT